jgi:hypothetical protein
MLAFEIPVEAQEKDQDCWGKIGLATIRTLLMPHMREGYNDLQIPRNVAPSGLPTCLSLRLGSAFEASISNTESSEVSACPLDCNEVFRRNSCVTATPMLAKASDVRSQARKVRSASS